MLCPPLNNIFRSSVIVFIASVIARSVIAKIVILFVLRFPLFLALFD